MNKILMRLGSLTPICIIILLLSLLLHVQAQNPDINDCSSATSNYTSNSPFRTNLNRLFSSLLANGTRDGFFNDTVGTSPDIIYGLVSCRGDLVMEDCRTCLDRLTVEIIQACPNGRAATLRYQNCQLRYSSTQFFSQVDNVLRVMYNTGNVSDTDVARYNRQLGGLMNNLSNAAMLTETVS